MKILILTSSFYPDFGAGAFRMKALVDAILSSNETSDIELHVMTMEPHRYGKLDANLEAVQYANDNLIIQRFKPVHYFSGRQKEVFQYLQFSAWVLQKCRDQNFDIVVATSSKLMTAYLGARIAKSNRARLVLDIRDLFIDGLKDLYAHRKFQFIVRSLEYLEKTALNSASFINLVSPGFDDYILKVCPNAKLTHYTNGIDDIFLDMERDQRHPTAAKKTVLYAGNIGFGQGLEKIIPGAALSLKDSVNFKIIGAGNARETLLQHTMHLKNVTILEPLTRDLLIEEYRKCDIMFLHLNNQNAFDKVLPSKIFEYAATNRPILAGVSGYARSFLEENVPYSQVFEPGSLSGFLKCFSNLQYNPIEISNSRNDFIANYDRKKIMGEFVRSILKP